VGGPRGHSNWIIIILFVRPFAAWWPPTVCARSSAAAQEHARRPIGPIGDALECASRAPQAARVPIARLLRAARTCLPLADHCLLAEDCLSAQDCVLPNDWPPTVCHTNAWIMSLDSVCLRPVRPQLFGAAPKERRGATEPQREGPELVSASKTRTRAAKSRKKTPKGRVLFYLFPPLVLCVLLLLLLLCPASVCLLAPLSVSALPVCLCVRPGE